MLDYTWQEKDPGDKPSNLSGHLWVMKKLKCCEYDSRGLHYKTFTAIIYGFPYKAIVLVPGKLFQPSLMQGAYPRVEQLKGASLG